MALTSVVQQRSFEINNCNIGLQALPNFAVNIPQSNQLNQVNSPEASNNILISSRTSPCTPFYQSSSLQNTYFATTTTTPGPDSFKILQQPLQAFVNTYSSFPANSYTNSIRNGHISGACLLPTPGPIIMPSNVNTCEQTENEISLKQTVIDESLCESSVLQEDQMSIKQVPSNSENLFSNQHTFILIMRLLMSGKEVGSIIGKRGENVKKYREESGARINISDGSSPERIVTVTGTTEQIFVAFTLMSQKFEDDFTQGLLRVKDEGLTCPPVTLRLLVPATQCGSIIGKGGSRIKDVREMTGASIQVASEALPTSTERTVTISGTAKAIAKCIRHLCDIFIESPAKGPVILYRPKPAAVNHSIMCPTSPYSSGFVDSTVAFPGIQSDNKTHGFANGATGNSIAIEASNNLNTDRLGLEAASIAQPLVGTFNMQHPKFLNVNGNTNIAYSGPVDSTSTPDAVNSQRMEHLFSHLLEDPRQLSSALNFPDYSANQLSLLNAIHPSHLGAGAINSSLINPISAGFTIPNFTINPRGLVGFYAPHPITNLGLGNNFFFSTPSNFVKPANVFGGGSSLDGAVTDVQTCVETTSAINQNVSITSTNDDLLETAQQTNNVFLPDIHTNNALLSLVPNQTGYVHSAGMINPVTTAPVSLLHNKSPILPVFPMQPALFSSATGLTPCSDDTNTVIKEIVLSNDLIGCIIGRGGTTVNEIRNISKAHVKISNCEDGAKDRKITLSGSPHSVNLAQFLINNRISAELFAGVITFVNR